MILRRTTTMLWAITTLTIALTLGASTTDAAPTGESDHTAAQRSSSPSAAFAVSHWCAPDVNGVCSALYRSYRHALPTGLFERMESDCRAMAAYENAQPTLKDGKRITRWFPLDTFPRTALEEAILHLVHLAKPGPRLVGFEWWIQQISSVGPMGFHVDKDESVASLEHYLLHPIWSSVFYVTNEGGGTLITNQFSPRGSGYEPLVPEEAAWSFPEQNKFLLFNGTLLHGVVPPSSMHAAAQPPQKRDRITFLVNFWHVKPKEPNCLPLDHAKVPGLQLLSRDDIMQLRQQEEDNPSPKAKRQPMSNIDLTPGSSTEIVPFRMDLPGGSHQMVNLPNLKTSVAGQTYRLHYVADKKKKKKAKVVDAAKKAEAVEPAAAAATTPPPPPSPVAAPPSKPPAKKAPPAEQTTSPPVTATTEAPRGQTKQQKRAARKAARRERERLEAARAAAAKVAEEELEQEEDQSEPEPVQPKKKKKELRKEKRRARKAAKAKALEEAQAAAAAKAPEKEKVAKKSTQSKQQKADSATAKASTKPTPSQPAAPSVAAAALLERLDASRDELATIEQRWKTD